ncbi:MAG: right-handed parallel beta-helix repeat-containing protein, partial [Candidatus Thermoplasmatota archaeon]|nr:right-handed parallel beta-helix repeat-containing protein [Candidatus Thermoplasmatota archaeon]
MVPLGAVPTSLKGGSTRGSVLHVGEGQTYTNIQDAIDNAADGETIVFGTFVFNENIYINGRTGLTLTHASGPIIEPASGIGIYINASSGITIDGFTINTTGENAHGIWVGGQPNGHGPSDNITITNCQINIGGKSSGIYVEQSNPPHRDFTITGNTISAPNLGVNLEMYDVDTVLVDGNTFQQCGSVSVVYASENSDVGGLTLSNNVFNGNGDIAGVTPAIWIESDFQTGDGSSQVSGVNISGNTFNSWTNAAIMVGEGVAAFDDVLDVTIDGNTFDDAGNNDPIILDYPNTATITNTISANPLTWQVLNTNSIQAFIDLANPGDTINVAAGTYNENLVINKALTLVGEDATTTIIDGQNLGNHVVVIAPGTSNVEITGFTIRNTGMGNYAGVALQGVTGCYVHHNIITANFVGVAMVAATGNTIEANTIDTNYFGVYVGDDVTHSTGNTITGNTIINSVWANLGGGSYSGDGIYLDKNCHANIITDNFINYNQKDGVYAWKANNHTIIGNTIIGNGDNGIHLMGSSGNYIANNTIENNTFGVSMRVSSWPPGDYPTEDNAMENNSFAGNGQDLAMPNWENIELYFSSIGDFTYFDVVMTVGAPGLDGAINRYWSIDTDMVGFEVEIVFTYEEGDLPAGNFAEGSLMVY